MSKRRTNSMRHTTEQFIERSKSKYGDKFSYTKTNYINAHTNITIYCNLCNIEFETSPNRHLRSIDGCCLNCQRIKIGNNKRKPISKFITQSKDIFGELKYDYSLVDYKNKHTKIKLKCIECDYIFEQTPHTHLSGNNGCSICGKGKLNTESFITKSKKIHINNEYDYSKVIYVNANKKIIIQCNRCGNDFKQTPGCHLSGRGCKECSIKTRSINRTSNKEDFVEKANKIFTQNEYDYTNSIYIKSDTNIDIYCNKCNEIFILTPNKHLGGRGCTNNCNKCPECFLWRTGGKLCSYCIPQKENKKYQKTKEYKIVKFLRENIDIEFIHNKSVGVECTLDDRENTNGHLYPDIRFDCLTFNLIVEIDEFRHRGSNYNCDERRMYDIIAKLGMPCVFIRYNPDNKDSNKNNLLKEINKYLEYNYEEIDFDDYGLNVNYMYYD